MACFEGVKCFEKELFLSAEQEGKVISQELGGGGRVWSIITMGKTGVAKGSVDWSTGKARKRWNSSEQLLLIHCSNSFWDLIDLWVALA